MGRGGYDITDASAAKSSVAQAAINQYHADQATAERHAEVEQAMADREKLIRSKKSRGIMDARRAAKRQSRGTEEPTMEEPSANKDDAGVARGAS